MNKKGKKDLAMKPVNPRPKGLIPVLIITGLMVYRIAAIFRLEELGNSVPEVWMIPLFTDIFIALTAPILVYLLWKHPNPITWMLGIVFHVIGIEDLLFAGKLMSLAPIQNMNSNSGTIFIIIIISLQTLSIALLMRYRVYYLQKYK